MLTGTSLLVFFSILSSSAGVELYTQNFTVALGASQFYVYGEFPKDTPLDVVSQPALQGVNFTVLCINNKCDTAKLDFEPLSAESVERPLFVQLMEQGKNVTALTPVGWLVDAPLVTASPERALPRNMRLLSIAGKNLNSRQRVIPGITVSLYSGGREIPNSVQSVNDTVVTIQFFFPAFEEAAETFASVRVNFVSTPNISIGNISTALSDTTTILECLGNVAAMPSTATLVEPGAKVPCRILPRASGVSVPGTPEDYTMLSIYVHISPFDVEDGGRQLLFTAHVWENVTSGVMFENAWPAASARLQSRFGIQYGDVQGSPSWMTTQSPSPAPAPDGTRWEIVVGLPVAAAFVVLTIGGVLGYNWYKQRASAGGVRDPLITHAPRPR